MLLLLTRPRHDTPTHYLFYWSVLLLDEAKKRNVGVIDLDKHKANRKKLLSYLSKQPVDTVVLNGHGSSESIAGHENEILISVGNGTELFRGKVVFARACDAGTLLGKEIMGRGAKGFIGYAQPFMFPIDKDCFNKPLDDKLAGPVLECSNQVGLSLIKGRSVDMAQEDSLAKYIEAIDKYSSSESTNSFLLPVLLWNMNCQVCYQ